MKEWVAVDSGTHSDHSDNHFHLIGDDIHFHEIVVGIQVDIRADIRVDSHRDDDRRMAEVGYGDCDDDNLVLEVNHKMLNFHSIVTCDDDLPG